MSKPYKVIERTNVTDIERFIVCPIYGDGDAPEPLGGYIEVRHNGCINLNLHFNQPLNREDWLRLVASVEAAFDIAEHKESKRQQHKPVPQ